MKAKTLIQIWLLLCKLFTPIAWAREDEETFVAKVNEAWCSSNYILLEEVIVDRIENAPDDDLLAMGLRFEYFENIIVNYAQARSAAQDYVAAVSNRMPSEIINRRMPVNMALSLLEEPIPTNFPASQLKTPEQMAYLHKRFPTNFPYLWLYRLVPERIEKLEADLIIDADLLFYDEGSWLENAP